MESNFTFKQLLESISILPLHQQGSLVEQIVLRLLHRYFKESITESLIYKNFRFDSVVMSGVGDLPGPTAIEIIPIRHRHHVSARQDKLASLLHRVVSADFRSLLLINIVLFTDDNNADQNFSEPLEEIKTNLKTPVEVAVWGNREIEELFQQYFESVSDLLPKIAQESTVKLIKKASTKDWKANQKKLLENLSRQFHERGVFLFLGAGCSVDAKLSSWSDLVNRLLLRLINKYVKFDKKTTKEVKENLIKALNLIETSPLLLTRKIRDGLQDTFEIDLREVLYEGTTESNILKSPLLKQLTRLCVHRPPGTVGVITYNFDDLLEIHLENAGLAYQIICDERTTISNDILPIYHVHGFIPSKDEWLKIAENSLLVFSEEGYHKLLNDPYFWANIIQLNCLRERTCVFIGLSLTDPSVRRILEAVSQNVVGIPRHYILLQRLSVEKFIEKAKEKEKVDLDQNQSQKVLQVYHELQQDTLEKLGINVIWYEKHEDVPPILNAIKTRDFDLKL